MRQAGALLLLLLTGSVLGSSLDSYYPRLLGTQWRYSSGEVQRTGPERRVRGLAVVPLRHSVGGRLVSEDLMEYRPDGVYLRGVQIGLQLTWYAAPLLVYPAAPLYVGQRWQSEAGGLRLSGQVIATEGLRTAAGQYNAYVIRTVVTPPGRSLPSAQYSYFVPGLGVVRYVTADRSTIDLLK